MSLERYGKGWRIRFRPYGDRLINLTVATRDQWQARRIEKDILLACKTSDYSGLSIEAKEAVLRMFENQKWELPAELQVQEEPAEELTLWKAVEIFLNYPDIMTSRNRPRAIQALSHVVRILGKQRSIKDIWIPDLKMYHAQRQSEDAANSTVNREMSALSRLFTVMCELRIVNVNPCRLVKRLSEKSGYREAYLSYDDVSRIADRCPSWYQSVIWIAYYSGMRRGEILNLKWSQINLQRRMIYLTADDTKEGSRKRIPIHSELGLVFEKLGRIRSLQTDIVVLVDGHILGNSSIDNPWKRAMGKLQWEKPCPRFHDLRHSWKVNALRSGIDYEIRETIMGHWNKGKGVTERYGYIDAQALVDAIDRMTFDHGETHIWATPNRAQIKANRKGM